MSRVLVIAEKPSVAQAIGRALGVTTRKDGYLEGENTLESAGVLLGDFVLIRDIVGAAIEDVVVNGVDPQEALDFATEETNQVLTDYASLFAE